MLTSQLNYSRMFITRRGVINANLGLVSGNAKIMTSINNAEAIFALILADAGIQESDITGTTDTKDNAWENAVKLGLHVCIGMRAYAEDIENWTLYNMMHYKKSDLEQVEMQESLNRLKLIYTQAGLVPIANLLFFSITAPVLTNYSNAITAFANAMPQHGVMQAAKTASTANIKKNFKLLRKVGKKLNNLVLTLGLTQPTFVDTYKNACKIINLGKEQMAEEKHLQPDEHVAIFKGKFLNDDTFTVRNHSDLAKIKVFLSDTTDVPATGGIEIEAKAELKLSVPTAFNMPFGHYLIILNEASMDDAHVTVVLAHGKSHSAAPTPAL